jgi:aspartate/glutamate racemase
MTLYYALNKKQSWYGESIGILLLDTSYPSIPGSIGNATTFSFPVRYKVVEETSAEQIFREGSKNLSNHFIKAAIELQNEGVKAIAGTGGFMAIFQKEISDIIGIPIFLSSLLQVPFIYQTIKRSIAVITSDARLLTPECFVSTGVPRDIPLVIRGMEDQKEFREAVLEEKGTLDSALIQKEVIEVAKTIVTENFDVGSILLDCGELSPYARDIQKAVHLPVFDSVMMINYVHSVLVRTAFRGFM